MILALQHLIKREGSSKVKLAISFASEDEAYKRTLSPSWIWKVPQGYTHILFSSIFTCLPGVGRYLSKSFRTKNTFVDSGIWKKTSNSGLLELWLCHWLKYLSRTLSLKAFTLHWLLRMELLPEMLMGMAVAEFEVGASCILARLGHPWRKHKQWLLFDRHLLSGWIGGVNDISNHLCTCATALLAANVCLDRYFLCSWRLGCQTVVQSSKSMQ